MGHVLRPQYMKEFREQTMQLLLEQLLMIREAARRLRTSGKPLKN